MSIRDILLAPRDHIKLDLATLQFIKNHPVLFQKQHYLLYQRASQYFSSDSIKPKQRDYIINWFFEINIILDHNSSREAVAYLGVDIHSDGNKFEQLSYSLTICEGKKVLRKYHFDYSSNAVEVRQLQPVFHLQYSGKLSEHHNKLKIDNSHNNEWLSEPRINFTPMTLAILLNLVFKEFPCESNRSIIETPEWISELRKSEIQLLQPFHNQCSKFNSFNRSKSLVSDFLYGL